MMHGQTNIKILGVSVPFVASSPCTITTAEGLKLLGYPTTVPVPNACRLERQYKDKDVGHSDMLPIQKRGVNGGEARVSLLEKP
jgi:hypothetical protein